MTLSDWLKFRIKSLAAVLLVCFGLLNSLPAAYGQNELHTVRGFAQGTTWQIKYQDKNKRNFKSDVDRLLSDIDRLFSIYRSDSEVSLFNTSHAIRFSSPAFFKVLKKSEEIYHASGGLFDPTVLPLIEAYGFGPDGRNDDKGFDLDSVRELVGFHLISFDSVSVRKSKEHVRLDFNAIAQGYSVDAVSEFLESKGVRNYLVEIGGELRGAGTKPDGTGWVVGIADPEKTDLLGTVTIQDRAMATSGNYRNQYTKNGVTYTHIINAVTGKPGTTDILSITVFAPDAMSADGYATAFLLMGIDQLKQKISNHPDLDLVVYYSTPEGDNRVYISERLLPYVSVELKKRELEKRR